MIVKKKLRFFCENRMTPHGGYTRVGAIFAKSSVGWEYVCGSGLNRRLMVAFSKDFLFFCIPRPPPNPVQFYTGLNFKSYIYKI